MRDTTRRFRWAGAAALALLVAACAGMPGSGILPFGGGPRIALSGDQEVPPVATRASGSASIKVAADRSVSGRLDVSGMRAIAAHIREGAPDRNGPVVISLEMTSETSFAVPAGARLSAAQYAAYRKGDLYINVRSDAVPGGEIRGQIRP
jgi:hypothetical protein